MGKPLRYLGQPLVRDEGDLAARDRNDVVFETLEREAVEIGKVAGNAEFRELTLPRGKVLGAGQPARKKKQRMLKLFPMANDRAVLLDLDDLAHETADGLFL